MEHDPRRADRPLNVGTLAGTISNLRGLDVGAEAIRSVVEQVLADPDVSLLDVVRALRR